MIENDHQMRAALEWMDYWKQLVRQEQSWLGREEARRQISILSRQVDDYRARQVVTVDGAVLPQGRPAEPAPNAAGNPTPGTPAPGGAAPGSSTHENPAPGGAA
jgi:hypothetical protein